MLTDKKMQEYADLGINVVGFKPQKKNEDVEKAFQKLMAILLTAEIVSIIVMIIGC